ncbi:hydrolase [Methylobacterium sp. E-005]|uniref:hydrolase n=1 Tax=Methylobacterium sp. E-005 TaxID=2836549 RepID=UPI001FBA624A|nr:hydrolase [Methylobacterium sp. E-005]MCJ2084777.1 hydrolase [Methylobacterium sp. E-005]
MFYLPGFDPRDPETYWGLFRREARLTASRRGAEIAIGDPVRSADGLELAWTVQSRGVTTRYVLLRWEDIVRARFPQPDWARLRGVPVLLWRLWRSGYASGLRREGWRFSTVIFGVHAIYLALVLLSLTLAACLAGLAPAALQPWPLLAVPPLAYGILGVLVRATRGKPLYVPHLVDDTAFTHAYAAGRAPEVAPRLDAFAARIRAAEGEADEVVVVGHSSSSFLGIEVLDRVLTRDPGFGTRGTPVSFVSIGSVIPWLGLDRAAQGFRAALLRFGRARQVGWIDVRAPWDWLSIHGQNPLAACDLTPPDPGRPAVLGVMINDLITGTDVRRRQWNLFQMHFQLLMASQSVHGFDYLDLMTGPEPVHVLASMGRESDLTHVPPRQPSL